MAIASTPNGVERAASRAAATPWAQRLARLGFAAKATVYTLIAALALAVVAGERGRASDAKGALTELSGAPWGRALVVLVGLGLACYALWFLLAGVADPGRHRRDLKGVVARIGKVVVGFIHASLAFSALRLALGEHVGTGDEVARSWTTRILALPAGTILVAAFGVIAAVVGLRQIRKGWKCRHDNHLRTEQMGPRLRRWAPRLGFAGFHAQGTVVLLIGVFCVQAALTHDPGEATGFDGALAWVARQPWGMVLLSTMALGLLAYAAWTALEARFRRLPA